MVTVSELFEMNIPRQRAIARVENLGDQINTHLFKLLGMTANDATRKHWKDELSAWFFLLASIRLKSTGKKKGQKGKLLSAKVYYDHLYVHMYGDDAVGNVPMMLEFLVRSGYIRNEVPVAEIINHQRDFYKAIVQRLASRQLYDDLIDAL